MSADSAPPVEIFCFVFSASNVSLKKNRMRIKILKVVTTYQSAVTILSSKHENLASCPDVELHVASSFEDPTETRKPSGKWHRIEISRTISPWRDLTAIAELVRLIRKERFDLIHTHTAKAGVIGAVAGALTNVPVVHTYHGLPFYAGQSPKAKLLYRVIESGACALRRVVFSQNVRDYNTLCRMKSIRVPVVLEGNGVDVEAVERNAGRDADRVRHSFRDDVTKILCVARLEPVKRLGMLIDSIAELGKNGYPCECIIAGKGPMKTELEESIREHGLSDAISIVYTPHIHALISRADIVVLTSEKEGIPRSLMEAMVLKKPIVATDVPGTNELVVHNKTGLLVSPNNSCAFSDAVIALIEDRNRAGLLGEAGRSRVLENFNDNKIVSLWLDQYRKLVTQKRAELSISRVYEQVGKLHAGGISEGFLSTLGPVFLARLYTIMSSAPDAVVIVAFDTGDGIETAPLSRVGGIPGTVVGFIAGSVRPGRTFHYILPRLVKHTVLIGPRLLRPAVAKKMLETVKYGLSKRLQFAHRNAIDKYTEELPELFAIAVGRSARKRGIGSKLVQALEREFVRLRREGKNGFEELRYTVACGAGLKSANNFYRQAGFELHRTFLHHGIPTNEYIRKAVCSNS